VSRQIDRTDGIPVLAGLARIIWVGFLLRREIGARDKILSRRYLRQFFQSIARSDFSLSVNLHILMKVDRDEIGLPRYRVGTPKVRPSLFFVLKVKSIICNIDLI
jgi:hypothetical protein